MAKENVASAVVFALRADGHDVVWIKEVGRGSTDDLVLAMALAENRVLLTFDKGKIGVSSQRENRCQFKGKSVSVHVFPQEKMN